MREARYESLREFALTMPGAWEDLPWGDTVIKVKKKIFVFLGDGDETSGISVKLDESLEEALAVDGAEPTGYGLGAGGLGERAAQGPVAVHRCAAGLGRGVVPAGRAEDAGPRARRAAQP